MEGASRSLVHGLTGRGRTPGSKIEKRDKIPKPRNPMNCTEYGKPQAAAHRLCYV